MFIQSSLSTHSTPAVSRRRFVLGASSLMALSALSLPRAWANSADAIHPAILQGTVFDLHIGYQKVNFTGAPAVATTVNGGFPGPTLRWKEGDTITLRVTNHLTQESSIHWHGIILPSDMDGVPGLSFAGIKPGETFEYSFKVVQHGTYWYHSHSGFQEQTGLAGSIIIDPKEPEPFSVDRDLVVMLSDWSDEAPANVYAKLKKMSHYYNFRERTLGDTWQDIKSKGIVRTWKDRAMWNQMRMSDRDIADVTGYTYTYLMNGVNPKQGWLGLFKAGEKLRLRIINGSAMSIFDVRIPGLKMTLVAADGQLIQPISVDEFRIGTAEVYDVIIEPDAKQAYTLFAQTNDRSGFARGTLTADPSLIAVVPAMDPAPVLGHSDMGMAMSGMDHSGHTMPKVDATVDHSEHAMRAGEHTGHDMGSMKTMDHSGHDMDSMKSMDHSGHDMGSMKSMDHSGHDMGSMKSMDHSGQDMSSMDHSGHTMPATNEMKMPAEVTGAHLAKAGFGSNFDNTGKITHPASEFGPHVDNHSQMPQSGLADPGIGLRDHASKFNRRVLTYADLRSFYPTQDKRQPTREIELHLTGNMQRYMWSVNGINFMEAAPLQLTYGERVRIILVNDTMMTHPIHLHGMWSELETGDPDYIPRKHTVLVQPGSKISYLVTADAKGRWAYHCHLMYHMLGMMREVRVI